jgi:hypothetical protein
MQRIQKRTIGGRTAPVGRRGARWAHGLALALPGIVQEAHTMQPLLQPVDPDAPYLCQAMVLGTPLQPAGTCLRPARWVIVAHDADGAALTTLYACDTSDHRTQCSHQAWLAPHVHTVSTDLIEPLR